MDKDVKDYDTVLHPLIVVAGIGTIVVAGGLVAWCVVAFFLLLMIRSRIVHRHVMRRLDEVHAVNIALILKGEAPIHDYRVISANTLLKSLDLSKWTYRGFYPADN